MFASVNGEAGEHALIFICCKASKFVSPIAPVGEIARLLEGLTGNAGVEAAAVEEPPIYPSDVMGTPRFLSRDKQAQITAWACAVSLANDIDCDLHQPCDAESTDLGDADAIYLRGAYVVGDIAYLLASLVQSFTDEEVEECEEISFSQQEVAVALLPELSREIRLSSLSAGPAILETDVDDFLQERSDTKLDDTAQDNALEQPGRSQVIEHIGGNRDGDSTDTPSVGEANDGGLLISCFSTMTDTTTSGYSLVTPAGSEVQSLSLLKGNFWSSSNQQEVAVAPLPELSREIRLSSLSARLAIFETAVSSSICFNMSDCSCENSSISGILMNFRKNDPIC
ncbi:hypothetical protein JB92DRAFT_3098446 [Gautieria morchelliformis]|nr:hypothetical protein JB92DRAFT_3098446 [Gautieria morchelliformis]